MRFKLIVNPVSGGGKAEKYISGIKETLSGQNVLDVSFTTGPKSGVEIARSSGETGEYDSIIAAGGDGTLNEVINGMMQSRSGVPVGFIPLGITSVFALSMGIPREPIEASRIINRFRKKRIDLGLIKGKPPTYFASMLGIGFDATVVKKVSYVKKQSLGKLAFILKGWQEWFRGPGASPFILDDGKCSYRGYHAIIGNTVYYAGPFLVTPHADPGDGILDVCLLEKSGRIAFLEFVSRIFMKNHLSMKGVRYLRTGSLRIRPERGADVQIDGDYWGSAPIEVESVQDALTVLVP